MATGKTESESTSRGSVGPKWLTRRLSSGKVILLDGATGTELEARGVPMHGEVWCGAALMEHGPTLQSVHEDYVRAGADVITANTFACNRYMLEPAGFGQSVSRLNKEAVTLARRAREVEPDAKVAVAGSISGFMSRPGDARWNAPETVRSCVAEQADLLAEAGVDLILLEMMEQEEYLQLTFDAAISTGLPVWVGCSCRLIPGRPMGVFDFPKRDFGSLLDTAVSSGAKVISVMHSPVEDTRFGLQLLIERFDGVTGAYPNSGHFEMPKWRFVNVISPPDFVAAALEWIDMGAQIIGGCCGLGPSHIRALKARLSLLL